MKEAFQTYQRIRKLLRVHNDDADLRQGGKTERAPPRTTDGFLMATDNGQLTTNAIPDTWNPAPDNVLLSIHVRMVEALTNRLLHQGARRGLPGPYFKLARALIDQHFEA